MRNYLQMLHEELFKQKFLWWVILLLLGLYMYVTGWLTLGPNLSSSTFHKENYASFFEGENGFLLKQMEEIENLKTKMPSPKTRTAGWDASVTSHIGRTFM